MVRDLITIGFDKNGEADFGIRGHVADLSMKEMQQIRAIIPVAIGVFENMWRDARNSEMNIAARSIEP